MNNNVRRGDIYYADLSPVVGSEQGGVRPVLIVQNDVGNRYSPTVIAAAITSQTGKARLPTHIEVHTDSGLAKSSIVLLEQIRTLDKRRLKDRIGSPGRRNYDSRQRRSERQFRACGRGAHVSGCHRISAKATPRTFSVRGV